MRNHDDFDPKEMSLEDLHKLKREWISEARDGTAQQIKIIAQILGKPAKVHKRHYNFFLKLDNLEIFYWDKQIKTPSGILEGKFWTLVVFDAATYRHYCIMIDGKLDNPLQINALKKYQKDHEIYVPGPWELEILMLESQAKQKGRDMARVRSQNVRHELLTELGFTNA